MAQSRHSKSASQHSKAASQHSKTEPQADPAPAPANVPVPATAPAPAQLALFSTLASAAKLLLEALGSRDLKADNHFTLETLRRAIRVSEPYIEIVLRELERHEISTQAGPSRSRQDGKRASKPESKSNSLLRVLPKIISIAAQLAKTREKRPNGSVRLTLLQELHEFLRVEIKAARKEVKRLEHVLEGKHKRPRHRRYRGEKGRGDGEGKKAIAAGGEGGKDEGGNGDGDGDGGKDDDGEDGSDGDEDDDGASFLRRGPASSNEAASGGDVGRSAGPSGANASPHNDDRALVIRVQSPSTHRSEREVLPLRRHRAGTSSKKHPLQQDPEVEARKGWKD
ncbi:hypothetical protein CKM354_000237300 [Cercospora kikuchii]|uniref:Uncharacterized protein n=1 Tax=Cercospora kikuchii TaxID=84275 RepID=A0A9P3CFH4_9PEZI|nr:uncharacterized protein CKM354_000237300 [Cercospora kikuchii]GIZ38980.1 hypothetical protein CKM354_000237300 [Cercospora kikuchii]